MRPYETMLILSTDLGDKTAELVSTFESVIRDGGGTLDANHGWGIRDLAYPIKKQSQGNYFLIEYSAEPAVVAELERRMRITEGVLRFLSVQQDHTGLPEERRRESYRDRDPRDDVPMNELRSRPSGAASQPSAPPAPESEGTASQSGPETTVTEEPKE